MKVLLVSPTFTVPPMFLYLVPSSAHREGQQHGRPEAERDTLLRLSGVCGALGGGRRARSRSLRRRRMPRLGAFERAKTAHRAVHRSPGASRRFGRLHLRRPPPSRNEVARVYGRLSISRAGMVPGRTLMARCSWGRLSQVRHRPGPAGASCGSCALAMHPARRGAVSDWRQ